MPPDIDEVNAYLPYMIAESSRHKLSLGYYVDGKLVCFMGLYPVGEYLRLSPPDSPKSKVMQHMRIYGTKMEQAL